MISKKKIVKAILDIFKKYPQGEISEEHITALVELYVDEQIRTFKKIIVNKLKDLIQEGQLSEEDLKSLIEEILSLTV